MILHLPECIHQALVADTSIAMARRTPAVAQAAAEIRAEELRRAIAAVPAPTTAFDVFAEELPPEAWTPGTKNPDSIRHACCAGCGRIPESIDPLPGGWVWDTMEPSNPWLWCHDCLHPRCLMEDRP